MAADCYECGDKGCAVCMPERMAWDDLRERLTQAVAALDGLADRADMIALDRLGGKVEGVKLALSYMDEWDRTHAHVHSWRTEGDGEYEPFRSVCEDCEAVDG